MGCRCFRVLWWWPCLLVVASSGDVVQAGSSCVRRISGAGAACEPGPDVLEFIRRACGPLLGSVYVYSSPALDGILEEILRNETALRVVNDEHAAEVAIHKSLLGSRYVTSDPRNATLYFVPFYGKLARSPEAFERMKRAVQDVLETSEALNASGGRDHLLVASSEGGAATRVL